MTLTLELRLIREGRLDLDDLSDLCLPTGALTVPGLDPVLLTVVDIILSSREVKCWVGSDLWIACNSAEFFNFFFFNI